MEEGSDVFLGNFTLRYFNFFCVYTFFLLRQYAQKTQCLTYFFFYLASLFCWIYIYSKSGRMKKFLILFHFISLVVSIFSIKMDDIMSRIIRFLLEKIYYWIFLFSIALLHIHQYLSTSLLGIVLLSAYLANASHPIICFLCCPTMVNLVWIFEDFREDFYLHTDFGDS